MLEAVACCFFVFYCHLVVVNRSSNERQEKVVVCKTHLCGNEFRTCLRTAAMLANFVLLSGTRSSESSVV